MVLIFYQKKRGLTSFEPFFLGGLSIEREWRVAPCALPVTPRVARKELPSIHKREQYAIMSKDDEHPAVSNYLLCFSSNLTSFSSAAMAAASSSCVATTW